MRVSIKDPRIVGFRGGKESSDPFDKKDHLALYLVPDGKKLASPQLSAGGGILPNPDKDLWNPQIISLASGNMSPYLDTEIAFNVGDLINGNINGIVKYGKNLFGDGEYSMIAPDKQDSLDNLKSISKFSSECLDKATCLRL